MKSALGTAADGSPASRRGKRRLYAFLGIGGYQPAEYNWRSAGHQGRTVACRYIQTALCESHKASGTPIDEVVLFLTQGARKAHLKGLRTEFKAAEVSSKLKTVAIPDGESEEQLWELFSILVKELSKKGTSSLIFDITHGFRALPWFAAAVLAFLSATGKLPSDRSVFYGLYRNNERDKLPSEIVELTPALDVITWGFGLTQFLNSGKWSEDLSKELRERTKSLNAKLKAEGARGRDFFNGLDSRLTAVSDALAMIRVGELLLKPSPDGRGALASLLATLDASESDVRAHIPPLATLLDDIRQRFEPFGASSALEDFSQDVGLKQLDHLVELYYRWDRIPEASTVLREAFTTLFCNERCATNPVVGKSTFSNDCRHIADHRCSAWLNSSTKHQGVFQFRNDINHAGFNADPHSKTDLKERFITARKLFQSEQKNARKLRRPLFLNISNHPLETWCDRQKTAALLLAEKIVDVPFPVTDPTLSEKRIQKLAKETIHRLLRDKLLQKSYHALVMGDFSLTFALIKELKAHGLECWVTTTNRTDKDSFHFVRLRRV